jgi:zinc transporter ZupT
MNLIGSFIHNFMDGLATGVAFGTGDSTQYIPAIIAIVAH